LPTALLSLQAEKNRRLTEDRLRYYRPYPKQRDFHAAGLRSRERLLMAGNQLGKTLAGGFEVAMHATGRYPDWWRGRRFDEGEQLDFVWFDEEPTLDIYTEGLTRTNVGNGPVWLTFTPLMGMSTVVKRFLLEHSRDRHITTMTIDDVEHYSAEEKEKIIASYPPHELEARTKGIPVLGSGRIFPVTEELITCEQREFPSHWPRIGGMDFGWDHPFAAVELVWDRDSDIGYGRQRRSCTLQLYVLGAISCGRGHAMDGARRWRAPALH